MLYYPFIQVSGIRHHVSGIRYSYFTWGTVSQWLLQIAPRQERQKVHVHKTNAKTNTHTNSDVFVFVFVLCTCIFLPFFFGCHL